MTLSSTRQLFGSSFSEFEAQKSLEPLKNVWAIGGGKGGVGKSLVTANVSICLSLMGYKVTTIDLDLGGANLHTCLGVPVPDKTLSDFLSKKVSNLEDLVTQTPIPNLQIISGAQDELGVANIKQMHKNKILSKLDSLKSDFVLFDLGAGTTFNTLDFFIHSSTGILVVLPEPTSIENTYRFIKSIFHRKLKLIEESLDVEPIINRVLNAKMGSNKLTPYDLLLELEVTHPEVGKKLISEIQNFRPKLIMNQVRTQADIDLSLIHI